MTHATPTYQEKKRFYRQILTIFGRKPVLEALETKDVQPHRLHFSKSNKPAKILDTMSLLAERNGAEIIYHSKAELSRISKNGKQDQGVALDIALPTYKDIADLFDNFPQQTSTFIALDNITNPQNLGMIIRSVCASPIKGVIIPDHGCPAIDSLVIKASAGTLFRTPIFRCESLFDTLDTFKNKGGDVVGLSSHAKLAIQDYKPATSHVYVLGNETSGLSKPIQILCDKTIRIPMNNQVESLNVAVTASLLAFRGLL